MIIQLVTFVLLYLNVAASFPGEKDQVLSIPGWKEKLPFKHYSGYLESINGARLHYWFFESQSDHAATDPLVLWLNGGPGCSSLLGALSENGPIQVNRNGSIVLNEYAWNQKANMLYLESPIGVGFSYKVNGGNDVQDDMSTAKLNFEALKSFYRKFPQYNSNRFYITGESYAGIYIPTLSVLLLENKWPTSFVGVAMGNALLDTTLLANSAFHYYYFHGLVGSTLWNFLVESCCKNHSSSLRQCDFVNTHTNECLNARSVFYNATRKFKINPYNIYDDCLEDPELEIPMDHVSYQQVMDQVLVDSLNIAKDYSTGRNLPVAISPPCLSQYYLSKFLNQPLMRKALHIDSAASEWTPCQVNIGYHRQLNSMKPQVKHMIDSGIDVLIYNGDTDSMCNFIGNEWFVEELGYRTRIEYHAWKDNGQVAGFHRFYDRQLTFVTFLGAGHMVPTDKPRAALKLFNEFINAK